MKRTINIKATNLNWLLVAFSLVKEGKEEGRRKDKKDKASVVAVGLELPGQHSTLLDLR